MANPEDLTFPSPDDAPKGPVVGDANPLKTRNYVVGGEVARGGMGAVLYAKDLTLRRSVAMKIVLPEVASSQKNVQRFVEEAQVMAQLEHPNVVPVHDLGRDEQGRTFYTMKLVKGVTLHEVLEKIARGDKETIEKYPLTQLLTVFQKVCDAVAFAHSRGVIHRDLKPENIMVGEYGEVLVMDWGLAKILKPTGESETESSWVVQSDRVSETDVYRTLDGVVMGTPQFMSPEQAEGSLESIDARSDIYALGGILYNMLTLQPPVSGDNVQSVLEKVRRGQITPPTKPVTVAKDRRKPSSPNSGHRPPLQHLPGGKIPNSLSAVAMKALRRARQDRYQTVKDLQNDIAAYQGGFATGAERAGFARQIVLLLKRNKIASIATVFLFAVSAAFTAKVISEGRRAARALDKLGAAAPSLVAQARALVAERKLDDAVEKIDFALTIAPQNADFHLQRAHLLQASLKLADAAAGYRRVLALRKGDASATANLALCEQFLARSSGGTLSPADLQSLLRAMLDQKREAEAAPLALQLGKGDAAIAAAIDAVVRPWKNLPGWNNINPRVVRGGDGGWSINLANLAISDIGPLAKLHGLPISELYIGQNPIEDLTPLSGLPLRHLDASSTKVVSLQPLRGMPLRNLSVDRCWNVTSLEGVQGMPLESLYILGTGTSDLTPLRGVPLKILSIGYLNQIRTLAGLEGAPLEQISSEFEGTLEDISALRGAPLREAQFPSHNIKDFSVLATCPKLEVIRFQPTAPGAAWLRTQTQLKVRTNDGRIVPMAEFWKEYDAKKSAATK